MRLSIESLSQLHNKTLDILGWGRLTGYNSTRRSKTMKQVNFLGFAFLAIMFVLVWWSIIAVLYRVNTLERSVDVLMSNAHVPSELPPTLEHQRWHKGPRQTLPDCAANDILRRNSSDTAWICAPALSVAEIRAEIRTFAQRSVPDEVAKISLREFTPSGLSVPAFSEREHWHDREHSMGKMLLDCAANDILKRNASDTAWVCSRHGDHNE